MKRLVVLLVLMVWAVLAGSALAADPITCLFPPEWKDKETKARVITEALSAKSGVAITPRIAGSYPEILDAMSSTKPTLVYAGSFVQAIIAARKLGTPLVQNADGKEMYSGILIYPKDKDPSAILKSNGRELAFAKGASSGESSAKAATGGQAAIPVANHGAAADAVINGKAKAAVVKDWWWLANEKNYPGLKSYRIPGISLQNNPDHVLTASSAIGKDVAAKISQAALSSSTAFGDRSIILPFDSSRLSFSLELMRKGGIDPLTYSW